MAAGNNIIGEVGLKVVPVDPNAQFQAGVDQIIKRLEKQAQFQLRASGLEQVEQQANSAGQAFASAAIQAAGLTAAIFGIRAAVEGAIGKLSGLFDQLAQARAGFTSILKSEAAGGKLLDDIREFARVSPFVTQELVNYSQQLLGVGLSAEKIIPLLKSTGDIISSVGGDTTNLGRVLFTLTQIKSIGALKGQDTMQLQNSLIPITKYLSEYLHKSSQEIIKLREDGKITADVVFAALNQQGEKVKGAMDLATRNIGGARAILSDTIIQLFQDQPVLNKIFQDTFKSIVKLANALGEEDFQQAFSQFFDGVNKVYEGLKPLLTALSSLVGEGVLSGMQVLGTILGTFGTVLSAIPKEAIEAIARLLLALTTLKAPLLLIGYITSIKTMASAIIPATSNLARLNVAQTEQAAGARVATASTDQYTRSLRANQAAQINAGLPGIGAKAPGFLSRNADKAILGASVAATIGGGILSQSDNSTAKTAGGALQGAGLGSSIGMLAGPAGAAVGAVIGGALGAVTSFMAQSEAKAKKHIEELKKLGNTAAEEFIAAEGLAFGTGVSGKDFQARKDEQERLKKLISDNNKALAETTGEKRSVGRGGVQDVKVLQGDAVTALTDANVQAQASLDALGPDTAAAYDPLIESLGQLVLGLDKTESGFIGLTTATKGGRVATTDILKAEKGLAKYGFTLDDLKIPEKREEMVLFIRAWDHLTTAQQNASAAANKYNTALTAAKATAAAIFDPQEAKLQSELDSISQKTEYEKAQYDFTSKTAEIAAELSRLKSQELVTAERLTYYQGLGWTLAMATAAANNDGEREYQRLLGLRGVGFRNQAATNRLADVNANDPANRNIGAPRDINKEFQDKKAADAKAAQDAKEAAEKAAQDALAFAEKVKSSTASLVDTLEAAAENIAAAAEAWVGSIKERTQYEASISAGRAISNTQKQIKDLTELAAGLAELRARGLSDEAIKSLGIDNISDVKQVRKLLKANPNDLTTLSNAVSERDKKATDFATAEEDKRTQKNIAEGIISAANALGMDLTKEEAAAVAGSFEFNINSNPDAIAAGILDFLTKGLTG